MIQSLPIQPVRLTPPVGVIPNKVKIVKLKYSNGDIKYIICPDSSVSNVDCLKYARSNPQKVLSQLPTDFRRGPCLDKEIIVRAIRCIQYIATRPSIIGQIPTTTACSILGTITTTKCDSGPNGNGNGEVTFAGLQTSTGGRIRVIDLIGGSSTPNFSNGVYNGYESGVRNLRIQSMDDTTCFRDFTFNVPVCTGNETTSTTTTTTSGSSDDYIVVSSWGIV